MQVPLVTNFVLSSQKGKEAWIEPVVDRFNKFILIELGVGLIKKLCHPQQMAQSQDERFFTCLISGAPISGDYADKAAAQGK